MKCANYRSWCGQILKQLLTQTTWNLCTERPSHIQTKDLSLVHQVTDCRKILDINMYN